MSQYAIPLLGCDVASRCCESEHTMTNACAEITLERLALTNLGSCSYCPARLGLDRNSSVLRTQLLELNWLQHHNIDSNRTPQ
ncbi:hypothetical protein BD309DRAFT_992745 [Dichomitus squalens]|uniref:Uncharacterized protein n=1 Tax=Dichomitus squalens TaxID=114155 RepID=A0A4Q9PB62_9APHY|nr:hypothetical protein BD309DRAFT_992745 [Dichomitus squalens]TBU51939.1 hypothetical protein BD310DRAFT_953009 [Dichomitus squalens]